jgi:hypothetical protein
VRRYQKIEQERHEVVLLQRGRLAASEVQPMGQLGRRNPKAPRHVRSQRAAAELWVPVIREHKWIIVAALKAELGPAGQKDAL